MDYQNDQDLICQLISDTQQGQHRQDHGADLRRRYVDDGERPGTSRDNGRRLPPPPQKPKRVSPEEKANNLIRKPSRAGLGFTKLEVMIGSLRKLSLTFRNMRLT